MITENITITKLKASEGMTLTNGESFEEAERIRTERDETNELLSVDS